MNKRKMGKREIFERNLVFLFAVFLGGFGIATVACGDIGTTPISSPNYVISLYTPLTLGMMTFIFNMLLIVMQIFIVGRKYAREHALVIFLQIPVTVVFSMAIDLGMNIMHLLLPADPIYPIKIGLVLAGSVLLAIGVSLQVCADVAMVSGEAFVKAISTRLNKEFGLVKTINDVSLVLLAVVLSLLFSGFSSIDGVREGTIIGALGIGPMVRVILRRAKPAAERIFCRGRSAETQAAAEAEAAAFKPVITITREYGCGGRMIGRELAARLKIKYYDNELIALIARESGMPVHEVARREGRLDSSLLYQMVMQDFSVPISKSVSSLDALFIASARTIRSLAKQEPCIIVGRGADKILRDNPKAVNVYLYADLPHKLAFCREHYHEQESEALDNMRRNDKRRAEYYQQYFGGSIDDPRNYELCLNVGALGMEHCIKIIASLYNQNVVKQQAAADTAAAADSAAGTAESAENAAHSAADLRGQTDLQEGDAKKNAAYDKENAASAATAAAAAEADGHTAPAAVSAGAEAHAAAQSGEADAAAAAVADAANDADTAGDKTAAAAAPAQDGGSRPQG